VKKCRRKAEYLHCERAIIMIISSIIKTKIADNVLSYKILIRGELDIIW